MSTRRRKKPANSGPDAGQRIADGEHRRWAQAHHANGEPRRAVAGGERAPENAQESAVAPLAEGAT